MNPQLLHNIEEAECLNTPYLQSAEKEETSITHMVLVIYNVSLLDVYTEMILGPFCCWSFVPLFVI